jgi:hypothetical protein
MFEHLHRETEEFTTIETKHIFYETGIFHHYPNNI